MKKYVFISYADKAGMGAEKLFDSKEEAVKYVKAEWFHLCEADKKAYKKDPAGTFRVDEIEISEAQLAAYEADEEDFTLEELGTAVIYDAAVPYTVTYGYEPFTGGEAMDEVWAESAKEAAEAIHNGLDPLDAVNMVYMVNGERFQFVTKTLYTACRETGDKIEPVDSVQEGLDLIEKYEETDINEGTYTPDFYSVIEIDEDGARFDIA